MKAWMEKYQPEVYEKLMWVSNSWVQDFDQAKQYCGDLINEGNHLQDRSLTGFAYYWLGNMMFAMQNTRDALHYADIAYNYLEDSDIPKIEVLCANLIGAIYLNSSVLDVSQDYFLKGIAVGRKHELYYHTGICYSNIGSLYCEMEDQETAIDFFHLTTECFKKYDGNAELKNIGLFMNYLIIANSYLNLKNAKKGLEYLNRAKETGKLTHQNGEYCSVYLLESVYEHLIDHEKLRLEYLQKYVDLFFVDANLSERLIEVVSYAVTLEKENDNDALAVLKPVLERILEFDLIHDQRAKILQIFWNHMEDQSTMEAVEMVRTIRKEVIAKEEEEQELKLFALKAQYQRNQKYAQLDALQDMVNKDTLTDLWNRRYFVQLLEQIKDANSICIGMLDFDYFKEYNDNYGHLAGDMALQQIAKVFVEHSDEQFIFSRYGGDEFIFLAQDLSKEEVENRMHHIFESIQNLQIEHLYSKCSDSLTMSCGAVWKEADSKIDFESLIRQADEVLYKVKRNERNHFSLV